MRKFLSLVLCTVFVFICSCNKSLDINNPNETANTEKCSGVWLSFYEVKEILKSNNFDEKINEISKNCNELGLTDIYLHVRSHCDAIYKSDYFPLTDEAKALNFDPLEMLISGFHKNGLRVHGWINPYRVKTNDLETNTLHDNSPVKKWLNDSDDSNDKNVCFANGIYLNPAEAEVQRLVIDGIKEIITKYDVDGIHFDDYFYPTTDESFDSVSYNDYLSSTENPLNLADWRRANVNALISGCYNAIKQTNDEIIFSISPAASIENNLNSLYANIEYWIENGIVDVIIPQLYFGFEYPQENFKFNNLLNEWLALSELNKNVKLQIGLGVYKANTETAADKDEWSNNFDIIARQVDICLKEERVSGYVLYSYSSLFSNNEPFISQKENLKNLLNKHHFTEV